LDIGCLANRANTKLSVEDNVIDNQIQVFSISTRGTNMMTRSQYTQHYSNSNAAEQQPHPAQRSAGGPSAQPRRSPHDSSDT
jgi:hypothetical protein